MHHELRHRRRRRVGWTALLGLLVASGLLLGSPVAAHPRHHPRNKVHGHDKHQKPNEHDRSAPLIRHHGPRHFVAPPVLRHVEPYRPYFQGRVYHRGHRHYHAVYDFPVYRDHRWGDAPHVYCGGELYQDGYLSYRGPRVSVRLRF